MGPSGAAVIAALLACGCRQLLGIDPAVVADGSAPPADAAVCADLSATCANDTTLRTCVEIGQLPVDTPCDLGCVSGAQPAHCGRFSPAGGAVTAADLDLVALAAFSDLVIGGTLDTDAGTIGGSIPTGVEFKVVGTVAIFRFGTLNIAGALNVVGTNSLAIVAEQITVGAVIDMRGTCSQSAPGPGGFAGGTTDGSGDGPGGGGAGAEMNGGGGGGHGGTGGDAGRIAGVGGPGGTTNGDVAILALSGGSGGGGGHQATDTRGGGGGGAIQLVSATTITIDVAGGINAGGCGGKRQGCPDCTQGGGGAGGTILLEALTMISIDGRLAVNGGGGGGTGNAGSNGSLDRTPAPGGNAGNGGAGGDGAVGSRLDGEPGVDVGQRPGGGGGGIGRIRFTTRDGTVAIGTTAILSPALDDLPTTATAAMFAVE